MTRPVAETTALVVSELCQVTGRPGSVSPAESSSTTLICSVCPIRMLTLSGVTETVDTGRGTGAVESVHAAAIRAARPNPTPWRLLRRPASSFSA